MSQILLASYGPSVPSPQTFTFVSNGDTNGLFYFIGRNYGVESWSFANTQALLTFIKESDAGADDGVEALADRAISYITTDNPSPPHWMAVDLGVGNAMEVTDYLLQNGSQDPFNNCPKNWKLRGSNNVAAPYAIGDYNAATWTDLDIRSGNTTIAQSSGAWGHFTCTEGVPTAFRFLQIITTGVNQTDSLTFLQVGEMEFYGEFTF